MDSKVQMFVLFIALFSTIVSAKYFECYSDCPLPFAQGQLIGCQVISNSPELLSSNGTKSAFFYNEFVLQGPYREDIFCYYNQSIGDITGISRPSSKNQSSNASGDGNGTPAKPGIAVFTVPKKLVVINMENASLSSPRPKPKSVTTPASYPVTHFTCTIDCPFRQSGNLVRCSIIYNFREKGKYSHIIEAPYFSSKKNYSKDYRVWAREENGKWIYDEILVCEYELEEGSITYVEPQTPYDRLGFVAPPTPEELEKLMRELRNSNASFNRTADSCGFEGVVLPPGYARVEGDYYAVDESALNWAFSCFEAKGEEALLVSLLREGSENAFLTQLFYGKSTMVLIGDYNWCVESREPGELVIRDFCPSPDAELLISQGALERIEQEGASAAYEEWGRGITYTSLSFLGHLQKLVMDLGMMFHSIISPLSEPAG